MAVAAGRFADDERPAGLQPGRGGFMRSANDTPYVTCPTGAVVKSGPRKGEPKRIAYGSPSGFSKLIENTKSLEKWGERRVVLGLALLIIDALDPKGTNSAE